VPINSAANKNNIANFFGNQQKAAESKAAHGKNMVKVEHDDNETRATTDCVETTEDNAPLPVPETCESKGIKREHEDEDMVASSAEGEPRCKRIATASPTKSLAKKTSTPAKKQGTRSATSNGSAAKTSKTDGTRKITAFFGGK
jgi:hypothetical protein